MADFALGVGCMVVILVLCTDYPSETAKEIAKIRAHRLRHWFNRTFH